MEKSDKKPKLMDMDRDNTVQEKPPGINVDPVEQDGIRVHPQPTSDPLDPLNWSRLQKNGILGIVMFKYVLILYSNLTYASTAEPCISCSTNTTTHPPSPSIFDKSKDV
jgi:hypothetical protein